jgi:NADPH-dependent 2,4-dienoyl-CoA reductase/sulfur reductase-like enzyme
MTDRFDVVVVGAGPGGLAAAAVAAEAGRTVCLVDDNPASGGQIWRGQAEKLAQARRLVGRVKAAGAEIAAGTRVVAEPERGVLRLEGVEGARDVRFGKLILATGARERFLPFPGWNLPGVMGAGAAQALLKSGLEVKGRRAVVAGSGPLLLAVAAALRAKGARVEAICEQAPLGKLARFGAELWRHPKKLLEGARYRVQSQFAPYKAGCWVVRAEGAGKLERVRVTDGLREWTVECDLLACGFNLVPNLELPLLLGCEVADGLVRVDAEQRSSREDVYCVGELTGVGGLDKALVEGESAGWSAAGRADRAAGLAGQIAKQKKFARGLERAFALRDELRSLAGADTLVCRCEDVTLGAMKLCSGWRDAKLHTRAGMGACQGRVCGAAAEFLLGWEKRDARPPVFPAAVETMSRDSGQ